MLNGLLVLLLLGASSGDPCEGKPAGEVVGSYKRKVGHGFSVVQREICVVGLFESVSHSAFLFYKNRQIAKVGYLSISPSGRFALFESFEGAGGTLQLFDKSTGTLREVTDGAFAIPRVVTWTEGEGTVSVTYYDSHVPTTISLER